MKILFLTTAHNSLSQRAFVELVDRGHTVVVVIASSEEVMLEAVEREHPDLIVAPILKKLFLHPSGNTIPVLSSIQGLKETEDHPHWIGPSSMDVRNGASLSCRQALKWMLELSGPRVLLP
jgi:hypothetical protein